MRKIFLIVMLITGFAVSSCNQSANNNNKTEKEQTAEVYTCPMHPEVKSDKMGKCPKCGMDLVLSDEEGSEDPDSSTNVDDERL